MAATARVVENLGVAAYLGAAHLISDPVLLTAAGSILTVEARHQTILNVLTGGSAIPQAFDIAFTPSQVLAVASPFISGCDLGVPGELLFHSCVTFGFNNSCPAQPTLRLLSPTLALLSLAPPSPSLPLQSMEAPM